VVGPNEGTAEEERDQSVNKEQTGASGLDKVPSSAGVPPPTKPLGRFRQIWIGVVVGVLSGVGTITLSGLVPFTNKVAVLEERITLLKVEHERGLRGIKDEHAKELMELKCKLYDQALEGFGEDCPSAEGQLSGTVCNYKTPKDGKRAERFRPPIQGLGRLCSTQP